MLSYKIVYTEVMENLRNGTSFQGGEPDLIRLEGVSWNCEAENEVHAINQLLNSVEQMQGTKVGCIESVKIDVYKTFPV
tara:strand:+ start:299 stop:535 length:237 start_codon:yes stop_codon:yes gene_type:complete